MKRHWIIFSHTEVKASDCLSNHLEQGAIKIWVYKVPKWTTLQNSKKNQPNKKTQINEFRLLLHVCFSPCVTSYVFASLANENKIILIPQIFYTTKMNTGNQKPEIEPTVLSPLQAARLKQQDFSQLLDFSHWLVEATSPTSCRYHISFISNFIPIFFYIEW